MLRNVTDRPESVEAGVATLMPPGGTGMVKALDLLWGRHLDRTPSDCYGTDRSASHIAADIARKVNI